MKGRGPAEPSGSLGSTPNKNSSAHSNGTSHSMMPSSKKRSIVFASVAASCLCIIQFHFLFKPAMTSLSATHFNHKPSSNANNIDQFINMTTPKPQLTLVHFDPYFLGGYRNQHMRFVSFVNFAVQHSIKQILLPSLRWGVAQGVHRNKVTAPHEHLFDVVHWNEHAEEWGLPRLVRYDPNVLEGRRRGSGGEKKKDTNNATVDNTTATSTGMTDNRTIACFNMSSNLYSGLDEQLLRNPNTNLRKVETLEKIGSLEVHSHCKRSPPGQKTHGDAEADDSGADRFTYLIPHGGSKGIGRLWADYNAMQRQRGKAKVASTIDNRTVSIYPDHHPVEKAINTILRTSEAIGNAVKTAIQSSAGSVDDGKPTKFLALHPRIEHDMLQHRCSRFMEKNLTKIFEHLRRLPRFDLLFIAVNTDLVTEELSAALPSNVREIALENAVVLNHTRAYGLFGNDSHAGIPAFESGSRTAENILFPEEGKPGAIPRLVSAESLGLTSLVASIVNFFTIAEAEVFVGVKGSSFSTDLFSVRHYMGKGGNYLLSPDGVNELVGPAPPHSCN